MRTFIVHTFIYFVSKGVSGLVAFLAILYYSRMLTPQEYGEYAILISIAGVINIVFFQWFRFSIARFYPDYLSQQKEEEVMALVKVVATNLSILLISIAIVLVIIMVVFTQSVIESWWFIVIGILLLQFLYDLFSQIFVTQLNPLKFTIVSFLKSFIGVGAGSLLVYLGFGYSGILIGLAIGFLMSIFYSINRLGFFTRNSSVEKGLFKKMLLYSMPFTATAALSYILTYSNRFLISYYRGSEETGLFTLGFDFTEQSLGVLLAIASTSAFPISMKIYAEEGESENLKRHFHHSVFMLLALALPAVTIFIGGYHDIVNVLFGDNFKKMSPILIPCVALGTFIIGIKSYYLDQVFYIKKATKIQAFILLGVATLNTVLNLIFIPVYGYEVAAINSVVSFSAATIITYKVGKKLINIPFPWTKFSTLLLSSSFMFCTLWLLPEATSTFMLTVKLILGLLVYLFLLVLFNKSEVAKLMNQMKGKID